MKDIDIALDVDDVYTVSFIKNGQQVNYRVDELLSIDPERLGADMAAHPVSYDFWAGALAEANMQLESAKAHLDRVSARLSNQGRQHFEAIGKRPTKADVEDYVVLQDEHEQALLLVRKWSYYASKIQGVSNAYAHRKDMLVNLSALQRRG